MLTVSGVYVRVLLLPILHKFRSDYFFTMSVWEAFIDNHPVARKPKWHLRVPLINLSGTFSTPQHHGSDVALTCVTGKARKSKTSEGTNRIRCEDKKEKKEWMYKYWRTDGGQSYIQQPSISISPLLSRWKTGHLPRLLPHHMTNSLLNCHSLQNDQPGISHHLAHRQVSGCSSGKTQPVRDEYINEHYWNVANIKAM